jgi:hypothetical protein
VFNACQWHLSRWAQSLFFASTIFLLQCTVSIFFLKMQVNLYIVFKRKSQWTSQHENQNVMTHNKTIQKTTKTCNHREQFWPKCVLCYIPYNNSINIIVRGHFVFLYCFIMCHYILIFVLWCPLRFPFKNDVRVYLSLHLFVGKLCLIYVICVCLP